MLVKPSAISCIAIVSLLCGDAAAVEQTKRRLEIVTPPAETGPSAVASPPTASDLAAQADAIARIPNARVRFGPHNVPKELEGVLGIYRGENPERELQEFMAGIRLAMLGTGTESLRQVAIFDDELGAQKHVRADVYIRGRPVIAGQLILHIEAGTGRVIRVSGNFLPDRGMPAEPKLQSSKAVSLAVEAIQQRYPGAHGIASIAEPILAYGFDSDRRGHLIWKLELSYNHPEGGVQELVMIDAWNGAVVRHWPLSRNALTRRVYTMNNSQDFNSLPGTFMFSEGGTSTDVDASSAYLLAAEPYSLLMSRFGRDSYDGTGKEIRLSVHYASQYNNANYFRKDGFAILAFGDGDGTAYGSFARDPDVVSHEFGHAVNTTAVKNIGFDYFEESGSLDEAFADFFSISSDAQHRGLREATWRLGELAYQGPNGVDAIRVVSDPHASPPQFDHRDHYRERYAGAGDHGGVHSNMTIPTLAFYLMVNGGDHPRPIMRKNSVPAIGLPLAQDLFWHALTVGLDHDSDFHDLRAATILRANVYGSAFATSVDKAWREVGIELCTPPPPPSGVRLLDEKCWGQYTMTWAAVPDAAWYQTQFASSSSFSPAYILSGGDIQGCEFRVSARTYLRVKACNQCGCSTYAVAPGYAQYFPSCL